MAYISGLGFVNVRIVGKVPPEGSDVWWAAEAKQYANYNEFAEFEQPSGHQTHILLTPYILIRHTPKGAYIQGMFGEEHFILGKAVRQFAVPTKELALRDLIARKRRYISILESRIREAEECRDMAEKAIISEAKAP